MKNLSFLVLLSVVFSLLWSCKKDKAETNAQSPIHPFKVIQREGRAIYVLTLPDSGVLKVDVQVIDGKQSVMGVGIISSEGVVYSADYKTGEFLFVDPETQSEVIYTKTDRGFERAPEKVQEKYQQASEMFKTFFDVHAGSKKGESDGKEMNALKEKLKELNEDKPVNPQ
jgi:hypothetical protein